jgi:glycosyltransferase involved in cell wall biosynthesis
MKILLVTAPFVSVREPFNGGTETFVVSLANELVSRGHQVDVLAKDADERNSFRLLEFTSSPLTMESTAYEEVIGQQHYMAFTYGMMDVSVYDVIHYNSYVPEIYEMGLLHNKPSLITLHLGINQKLGPVYELFCKQTGAIPVSISERIKDAWESELQATSPIIHNGIDSNKWPLHERNKNGYLLWTGRINQDKNPEAAIKIAQHFNRQLKIAGKIYDQDYFDANIQPHLNEAIEYLGHLSQQQVSDMTAGASAYLATATWQEPFGLSTVEMLASGLPVVGFASAIPPELRKDNISVAVESDDWRDLLPAFDNVTDTSAKDCRAFARNFTIEKMAAAYEKLYRDIS